jgi:hypothetical protein
MAPKARIAGRAVPFAWMVSSRLHSCAEYLLMFESTLATTHDADLILKLYQLRQEATIRQARTWICAEFFPESAGQVLAILSASTSENNAWFRQVTSYWDMAAAFVLHGALNAELFLDCNNEPFFLYAKFEPFLADIRKKRPGFFTKLGKIIEEYPEARARVDQMAKAVAERRAAALAAGRG